MHVVLVAPEIHMNTGNAIRLCANTGSHLHLVEPLGFQMESAALKRAGLDYHDLAQVTVHPSFDAMVQSVRPSRMFAFSSRGRTRYDTVQFGEHDAFVFGAERAGLTVEMLARFDDEHLLYLPMQPKNRSLNLANTVAIVVYEAWRQQEFAGSASIGELGPGVTAEHLGGQPFDS